MSYSLFLRELAGNNQPGWQSGNKKTHRISWENKRDNEIIVELTPASKVTVNDQTAWCFHHWKPPYVVINGKIMCNYVNSMVSCTCVCSTNPLIFSFPYFGQWSLLTPGIKHSNWTFPILVAIPSYDLHLSENFWPAKGGKETFQSARREVCPWLHRQGHFRRWRTRGPSFGSSGVQAERHGAGKEGSGDFLQMGGPN